MQLVVDLRIDGEKGVTTRGMKSLLSKAQY